jgi:glucose/arabinose dehydrogenase
MRFVVAAHCDERHTVEVGMSKRRILLGTIALTAALAACDDDDFANQITAPDTRIQCDASNAGLTLPAGFCALVVADLKSGTDAALARHMVVTPNGDVFVAINSPRNVNPPFGILGLRDTDGDGHADQQTQFSANLGGSGLAWNNGVLYFGANDRVLRFQLPSGQLSPTNAGEIIVSGLPSTGDHISKTVVFANAQTLLVNIGSASNACQVANRQLHSPGQNPCPELSTRAGVWAFNPAGTNLSQTDGRRYAAGLRNMVALAWNSTTNQLFGVQHGRDMLFENWPENFDVNDDATKPAEEFIRITEGSDNGWPYCYYDAVEQNKKVLAPEYGGNGVITSGSGFNCASYNQPLTTFGAHWAPNGMTFYSGSQFPLKYRNGAFVAFHGGFDRAPLPNEGYQVMFVPMNASGAVAGAPEAFADGFAGSTGALPATAVHRPVGVTEGPDGSLYVSDDKGGRIYRIIYRGQ